MPKKRKLLIFLSLFLIIGITYTTSNVRGHAPSNMSLTYNSVSEELTVSITHNVGIPSSHYVYRVRTWVNASLVNTTLYDSQPSTSTFVYLYNIIALNGSTIQVTAECNQGGSITRSINIGSTNGPTEGPAITGFLGLGPIITLSVFILTLIALKREKNKS